MSPILALSRFALTAAVAFALTGCISTPVVPVSDDRGAAVGGSAGAESGSDVEVSAATPIEAPQSVPDARNEPPPPLSNPALAALVNRAQTFSTNGQWDLAAAELERGIRIAPQDGQVWLLLAEARYQQGQKEQAGQLARRALTLVPPGSGLAYRAQELIDKVGGQ